ncbi:transcription termination factor MTERF6, chloroplastic/mitochondrial-like [Rhododendron vialii]|uniref:transcription termination factor MTERF6, chloroplastic/mitochondrial-like n=1 Tax=Rhododendron vialii TaxID=182163 RepID=UPI00265E7673|nr:transcription termination factor MTERF6, chloroplastic/mitochondrial-like [Rhododendron vialii]
MVSKYPRILSCSVEKTLKPKIDFLRSVGLSKTEFLGVVTTCPMLFTRSLKNHLVPIVEFLITSFGSRDNAVLVIKRYPFILFNTSKRLVPNLSTLRNLGIPQSQISNMMAVIGGRVITCTKPCRFIKVVSTAMEMGFDPLSLAFKNVVSAMLFCPGSTWEDKLMFYKTLGFSDEETLDIFRFNPSFISRSEEVIRGPVEFYVSKFHWSPSQLSRRPVVLTYSLEKRIIPRCLVVQVLLSRNKIQENVKLSAVLICRENEFLRRYVIKYKDEIPEVLDAYHGKMKSAECDFYWEELSRLPFKIIL